MKPIKAKANELLRSHGPTGFLIRTLQRYALLGWALFFFVLIAHFIILFASTFSPRPVVAVDASGKVLGTMEYLSPTARSDAELIAASMRFATLYMSLNSATIFDDYAEAMNMMGPELLAQTRVFLKSNDYLTQISRTKARSWLEFSQNDPARVVTRNGLNAQVRLSGNIVFDAGQGPVSKPFDITLETEAVARNTSNTSGLIINSRKDN